MSYAIKALISGFLGLIILIILTYKFHPEWATGSEFNFLSGFAGVLLGGIISYMGNIHGAQTAYSLNQSNQTEHFRKLFIAQLRFSYNKLLPVLDMEEISDIGKPVLLKITRILYDKNWFSYVFSFTELSLDEIDYLINWFSTLDDLEAKDNFDYESVESVKTRIQEQLPRIKAILNKIDK